MESLEDSLFNTLIEIYRVTGRPAIAGRSIPPSAEWSAQHIYEAVANWSPSGDGGSVDLSAIAEDVLPATDDAYDLGSQAKRWKDVWLSGAIKVSRTHDPPEALTFISILEDVDAGIFSFVLDPDGYGTLISGDLIMREHRGIWALTDEEDVINDVALIRLSDGSYPGIEVLNMVEIDGSGQGIVMPNLPTGDPAVNTQVYLKAFSDLNAGDMVLCRSAGS